MKKESCAVYSETSAVIRIYHHEDVGKVDYKAIVSVVWVGFDEVHLFGASGFFSKSDIVDVFVVLYDKGAKRATLERVDGRRMPFSRFVKSENGLTTWAIDDIDLYINKLSRISKKDK